MNLSTMSQRELRDEHMTRRRRCKKLHNGQAKLEKELDRASKAVSEDNPAAAEHVAELLDLSRKAATLMQVFRIDAWETRAACERRGIPVPAPHRSEGQGFRDADPEELARLRERLEAENGADAEALIADGRV